MRVLWTSLCVALVLLFVVIADAKIVFRAGEDGISKIYVMDDDGGNIRQITNNAYSEWKPRWSPNGRRIAFIRDTTPNDSTSHPGVYIMHADGTNDKHLVDKRGGINDITFSPDGKRLIYTNVYVGLHILDIDTRNSETILNNHAIQCDWAPDGKRIVYINDDHHIIEKNLWLVDIHGYNPVAWTHPDPDKGAMHRLYPRWSSDGRHMLYTEMDIIVEKLDRKDGGFGLILDSVGTYRYVIQNIRNGETQTLKIPENLSPSSLSWMDENQSVLFSAYEYNKETNRAGTTKIYKYDLASDAYTFLAEGSDAHWNGGALSVSLADKQSVRWAELKRMYVVE